ncbi:CBM96 family carbohydrate-binding protein [Actinopolymorpha singaporensis]
MLSFTPEPTREPIASVTLQMYGMVRDTNGTEIDVSVYALDEGFDEATVTWNTQPARGARLGAMHVTDSPNWCGADLTEALRAAVAAGERIDLGLDQDLAPGQQGLATPLSSRESSTKPYLLVRLETPVSD